MIVKVHKLTLFIWVAAISGYPLVAGISAATEIPNFTLSLVFRGSLSVLSAVVILACIRGKSFTPAALLILGVFFLYGIRLALETLFDADTLRNEVYTYWVRYIGATVLPSLAVLFGPRPDLGRLHFYLGVTTFLVFILIVTSSSTEAYSEDVLVDTGRAALESLNPISLSLHGAVLCLLGLWGLFGVGAQRRLSMLVYFIVLVAGGYLMYIGASRGPIVAFLVCVIVMMVGLRKDKRRSFLLVAVYIGVPAALAFFWSVDWKNSALFDRMMALTGDLTYDTSSLQRLQIWTKFVDAVIQNPLFGTMIESQSFGGDAHNIVLEYFAATGFFGGLFFIFSIIYIFRLAIRLLGESDWSGVYSLFFVLSFVAALFSGNFYMSSMLWISACAVATSSRIIVAMKQTNGLYAKGEQLDVSPALR